LKLIKKMVGLLYNLLGLPYYAVLWTIKNTIKVLKSIPMYSSKGVNLILKTIKNVIFILIKPLKWLWKIIKSINTKGILVWIIDVIKESIAQIFTLLGFFIAWFTLTGTAQDIVGIAIIISTIVWLLTIRLRD
tara:strand:+ start:708 stop:1106 length:399 start_codon:yes stop_codon:yes gene_type:complete